MVRPNNVLKSVPVTEDVTVSFINQPGDAGIKTTSGLRLIGRKGCESKLT
ncbi:MAG TPA: hypothetical protein VH796_13475 [Nitrososphaeraceae archaeon]